MELGWMECALRPHTGCLPACFSNIDTVVMHLSCVAALLLICYTRERARKVYTRFVFGLALELSQTEPSLPPRSVLPWPGMPILPYPSQRQQQCAQ